MSDSQSTSQSLSEIGHLFLSSVRSRQTDGATMPRRQPPGAPREPVMVTLPLRESDREKGAPAAPALEVEPQRFPPVTALLSAHLSGQQREKVLAYARHLAARGQRIGLIELDVADFRITCFEKQIPESGVDEAIDDSPVGMSFDPRMAAEALQELSWDVDRWLLLMPAAKALETKCLLRDVGHWALLGGCDHDGVVSCYRTLKGLNPGGEDWPRPRLTLALLDCADDEEADRVHRKLSGVCQQFLGMPLEAEAPVQPAEDVAEHNVMACRVSRKTGNDKGAVGPHWGVVAEFVARAKQRRSDSPKLQQEVREPSRNEAKPMIDANPILIDEETRRPEPVAETPALRWTGADPVSEVIDLPDGGASASTILAAVLRSESAALLECPITPPTCPEAKLAVTRDRRLVLLAVGKQGLADLRSIGRGYQWLAENRSLIAMALPQVAIDTALMPQLRLFVDHADLNATALQPMLQAGAVTVQAYRRLKWGGKSGLLLEAA